MKERTSADCIQHLNANEIFVFGSNIRGRHGLGAAFTAAQRFGAAEGVGLGRTGFAYAIPTKPANIRQRLPLNEIAVYVAGFLEYAKAHPELIFLVTAVGCGYADYTTQDIAPMFRPAVDQPNVHLPAKFWAFYRETGRGPA